MSDDLYRTRLRWSHGPRGSGVAMMHGHRSRLAAAPVLGGREVWACDYVPEIGLALITTAVHQPERDMLPGEIADADNILRGVCGAASLAKEL